LGNVENRRHVIVFKDYISFFFAFKCANFNLYKKCAIIMGLGSINMMKNIKKSVSALGLLFGLSVTAHAALITEFEMELVVDNDFAVFSGNSSGVSAILYQNDVVWNTQASALSTLTFSLQAGDDRLYVLAMDGGGITGIGGTINGVNIIDSSIDVQQSSNIRSGLSGYANGTVASGTYNVDLNDVQGLFSLPSFTFGAATLATPSDSLISPIRNIFGGGFVWGVNEAVLFSFGASDLNINPPLAVGAPASGLIALAGLSGMMLVRKRFL
jgi:hypothetical protein